MTLKTILFLYHNSWKKKNLYTTVEKVTVFQHWKKTIIVYQRQFNNVSLSTLNQCWNLKLKQYWFWVDTKKVLLLCYDAQEVIIGISALKKSAFQSYNIIILSTLKQRKNLMLKKRRFLVDTKTNFVLMFTDRLDISNQSRQVSIDVFPRHFNVLCWCKWSTSF